MQLFSMLRTKTLDSVAVGLQDAHLRMNRPFEPVSDSSRVPALCQLPAISLSFSQSNEHAGTRIAGWIERTTTGLPAAVKVLVLVPGCYRKGPQMDVPSANMSRGEVQRGRAAAGIARPAHI